MGALYLEAGLQKVKPIVISLLEQAYPKIDLETIFQDYKTTLQEFTQANQGITPEYILENSSGPDHKKEFEVSVNIRGHRIAIAKGRSKKQAQQNAAKIALELLNKEK
jgi:ribonuclease-3